jgi:hypothetical protein
MTALPTGTAGDILNRVKQVLPRGWFAWLAPYRDAIIGALSDRAAWCYSLIIYARAQTRLATATGPWLDVFSYDFLGRYLPRAGAPDIIFRTQIRATILQERVTRAGMINALKLLTGNTPWIFEPWNTYDTGCYSAPGRQNGQFGYGVGRGGYGNMNLPGQVFVKAFRGSFSGVANVAGYGTNAAGYERRGPNPPNEGASEYIGPNTNLIGVTNAQIYQMIVNTKPSGVTCWTAID